jgi:hypothetical protein
MILRKASYLFGQGSPCVVLDMLEMKYDSEGEEEFVLSVHDPQDSFWAVQLPGSFTSIL